MKSSTRFGFILMAILVLVIFALPTFAQMGMQGAPQHPGPKGPPSPHSDGPFSTESIKERLGLTDEQVEKFSKIRSDYLKESIKKQAEIKVAGVELLELLDQKKMDQAQIEKKLRQIETLKTDLALFRIKMLFKTKDFLNDDQFAKLKSMTMRMIRHGMMEGRMGRMESGMMGQGMGRGMGGSGMMGPGMTGQGGMGQGMMGRHGMDSMGDDYDGDD